MKGVSIALAGVMALTGCTSHAPEPTPPRDVSPAAGSYEFYDIVVRDSDVPTRPNAKAVKFQVRWLGSGPPQMVACVFGISHAGGLLITKRVNVYSAEDSVKPRLDVILSDPAINGKPSASLDATIECQPLTTPDPA